MHLRTLVLHGFKSFSRRTQLEFEPGITAVVGPNGSGKSNLADAFRWVLGEQSLRALRGRKTEDVLFAGGISRPPSGMAEVELQFDISSPNGQVLSLPYAELSVARRAYRSGENEYYVNQERSRLRDVTDLLGQVGLALDGFGLVGQGAIDAALSLRAEDRRVLVEQAAAIGHLQARLDDARARLATTRENLTRIAALVAELEPQQRLLARQAAQVHERCHLVDELNEHLRQWYAHLLAAPLRRRRRALEDQTRLTAQYEHYERQLRELDEQRIATDHAIARIDADLTGHRAKFESARARQSQIDRSLALCDERLASLKTRADEVSEQVERLSQELVEETSGLADIDRQRSETRDALTIVTAELTELEQKIEAWESERIEREGELRRARKLASEGEATVRAASNRRRTLEGRLAEIETALTAGQARQADLQRAAIEVRQKVNALDEPVLERRKRIEILTEQRDRQVADVDAARSRATAAAREMAPVDRELAAVSARADALRSVEEAGTGYYSGVRAVLQATRGSSPRLSGIVGVVARLIVASANHELAIETALGGHAQDIVVERWADAEAAIAFLKSTGAGRSTFLPLDTLRSSRRNLQLAGPGVIGMAADLVEVDSRFRVVAEFLLGQTAVVESLSVARRLLKDCPPALQIVTLEGDLSRATGVVTGGAPVTGRGTLARYRERREAEKQVATLTADRERLAASLAQAREAEVALTAILNETLVAIRSAEDLAKQTTAALNDGQRHLERAEERNAWHREELSKIAGQRAATQSALEEICAVEETAARDYDARCSVVERLEAAFANRQPAEALLRQVYDRRSQRDRLRDRSRALDASRQKEDARFATLRESARAAEKRLVELEAETAQLKAQRIALADERERSSRLVSEAELGRTTLDEERNRLVDERQRDETARRALEPEARRTDQELRQVTASSERAAAEIDGLHDQVRRDLGDLDEEALKENELRIAGETSQPPIAIAEMKSSKAAGERIDRLRARIQQLPADSGIIAEHDSVSTRLRFLEEQLSDLGETSRRLEETIEETRRAMRERFDETFTAVNAAFERRFGELFGGGAARLTIDGGEDIPGVEVFAQPPGKRSQNLAMLSGGERALTAAALLFSLIEINPPPFCVLDEVDAALDENNVSRFGSALRDLSNRTQFVVITHNRRTMEVAEAIYGLTLENRGESRVLSLKLPNGSTAG